MILIRIFAFLPFPLLHAFSSGLAFLLDKVVRYRRKVVEDNLRHAFPDLKEKDIRRLRREFYLHFTDVWMETIKALNMSEDEYRRRVMIENPELVQDYVRQGRPLMVLASHRSGWELITPASSLVLQVPIDAVYKQVKSPFFNKLMHRIRSRFGTRMLEKGDLLRDSIQRMKVARVLAIMFDQSPHKGQGHRWVSFMNRPAPFYNSTEKLARKLQMPVAFADMDRVARGYYRVRFHLIADNPKDLPEGALTDTYVRFIEEGIRRRPADYLWSHRRWKHTPPAEKKTSGSLVKPGASPS